MFVNNVQVFSEQFGGSVHFVDTDGFSVGTRQVSLAVTYGHDRRSLTHADPAQAATSLNIPDSNTLKIRKTQCKTSRFGKSVTAVLMSTT